MEPSRGTVLVVGLGASGLAVARLLRARGHEVVVNDVRDRDALGAVADEAESIGARLVLGSHPTSLFTSVDRIVVSPGVPPLPALEAADAAGVPVASEVEVASWFIEGTVVAITGTNGKSTVTSMVGAMCERSGRPTFIGGNLGTPLVEVVDTAAAGPEGVVVVELSSFQLERVDRFRANVAVLLNVTADHLDRYESFASYAAAKGRIFHGQRSEDAAVVPDGDEVCNALARAGTASLHTFGPPAGEVRAESGRIVDFDGELDFPVSGLRLRGGHNTLNACAAALAARLAGIDRESIEAVLNEFAGLPHRMEHVRDLDEVTWFDDSKATNVGASVAAIDGLDGLRGKIVLIAGGKDKGGSYEPLRERMEAVGRAVVVIGEASELIAEAFEGSGLEVVRASTLEEAVGRARALARVGDAVVLAPACASFDMFRSYAHRGEVFQAAVRALTEGTR